MRRPLIVALAVAALAGYRRPAVIAGLAVAALAAQADNCPAPVRTVQAGDRCTAEFRVLSRDTVERVPVYVLRFKSLEAADLSSWAVPGAVVVPLDGLQRGQQVAVPLSILSECRP